jgi:hypothetical protein
MEAAVWPVAHAGHQTMFHRIEMNVIDMACQIFGVTNRMLPKPALPKTFFAFGDFANGTRGCG